jgi:hypothetical protein
MSDTTGDKKPKPIFNPDDVDEAAPPAVDFGASDPKPDPTPADVAVEEPVVEKPAEKPEPVATKPVKKPKPVKEPAAATATGAVAPVAEPAPEPEPASAAASEYAGREVVYVQAPVPPKLRSNRGVGSLLAVLGAVVFAALFAIAAIASFYFGGTGDPMGVFAQFIQNYFFWVPVLVFLVAFVLLVLVVNRAGWAAHVFGSLLVGLAVYFGSIGILLAVAGISAVASGGAVGTFGALATNPLIIIAALVAREVSIWIGLAIAARGRRVKVRNLELVDEWEAEHAETKAQYERAGATA